MSATLSTKDRNEFNAFLRNCTDGQVLGVMAKETAAGRDDYVELAEEEMKTRGLTA